jgi:Tfp pilus assembly protein PilF
MRQGRAAEAEREFREVVRLDPKRAEAYANLGTLAYTQGHYPDAAQCFAEAIRLNPSLHDAQAFLGLSQVREGHAEEGRRSLEQSWGHIRDKELRVDVGTELIRLDQQQNRWDKAADVARDLAASNPNDPRVLYLSYRVYSELC